MSFVQEEKSWLEWVVFGLSTVLVLILLGYLVYETLSDNGTPPDLVVSVGEPRPSTHGYVVPVKATNKGESTARAVELEVFTGDDDQQRATLTHDFLSPGEEREGWVGFSGEPSSELRVRVVGYRTR